MIRLKCSRCGYETSTSRDLVCPVCGSLMHPIHGFEWRIIREYRGIWRYKYMLPKTRSHLTLGEASTPLISSEKIMHETVFFKDEGRNPTGSFRDRAAALIVSDALDMKAKRIVLASDGNMGASVAAYSARAGIPVTIYVPSWTDSEKIMLMKAFGANVLIRDKSLDELLRDAEKRARKEKIYNASSTYNALSIEGLKTIAIEIVLDLGRSPSEIILPLGSGLTLLSIYHGFTEMLKYGVTTRIPKLIGVETCGNPLYSSKLGIASKCGEEPLPGLSYHKPVICDEVLDIIQRHGEVVVVSKREVLEAARKLAREEGLFVEPSSAVALAGALKIGLNDYSVIILTGHGLKGPSAYSEKTRERSTILFPGSTKHMIIELLRENPGLTGYSVWKKLGLKITPQAVYQHLHELVEKGYLRIDSRGGVKKYYLNEEFLSKIGRK